MDEHLVGYLLNSLDPETRRQVEEHLRASPEARQRLELLRRAMEPLAADAEPDAPTPGLWVRTLARVAEHQCRRLPAAPKRTTARPPAPRARWRRADLLVAASVFVVAGLVSLAWLGRVRHDHQVAGCQNNLRQLYQALATYAAQNDDAFPRVERLPPKNVAGIFVPVLNDAGVLPADVSLACPGPGPRPLAVPTMDELRALSPEEFRARARGLAASYAYTLGYVHPGANVQFAEPCGLRRGDGDNLPLLADRPAVTEPPLRVADGNSVNHGRRGQNVLHVGGNVRFLTDRAVGPNRDDIYCSNRNRVEAGVGPADTVLGPSWASAFPTDPD